MRSAFRPCIDLHEGRVKQIVGGTLNDEGASENFVSDQPADWYAARYRDDQLTGGHVIKLGPGNDEAARAALAAWPGGLQVGGGISTENAATWLDAGAAQVIVTSYLFEGTAFAPARLAALTERTGPERLIIDLSCRRDAQGWVVAMNRWQTLTDMRLTHAVLDELAPSCCEFLIHAADVEGKCQGIDQDLVRYLGEWQGRPMVYAGGARQLEDLARVNELSQGRVDLTIGSALDLFGGSIAYADCVAWNQQAK